MKNNKILILFLLLALSIFASCSHDTTSSSIKEPSSEKFIGEWYDDKNQTLIISESYIRYNDETFSIDNLKFGSELSSTLPVLKNNLFIKNDDFTFEYLRNNALICSAILYSYTDIETNENLTLFSTLNGDLDLISAMEFIQAKLEAGELYKHGEIINPKTVLTPTSCTVSGDIWEYIKLPVPINSSNDIYIYI